MFLNKNNIFEWVKLLRIHQWIKNLLLFTPLFATKNYETKILFETFYLFFIFSFFVSTNYIINDIFDIEFDRRHKQKKNRPIASGKILISHAKLFYLFASATIIVIAFYSFEKNIVYYFLFYSFLTLSYSKIIKFHPIFDLAVLTFFYVFRVYLGGEYNNIEISNWLLFFCFFFFGSLSCVKRITELKNYKNSRGYKQNDLNLLIILAISFSISSSLIMMLYLESFNALSFISGNKAILIIPFLINFWLLRVIYLAINNNVNYDPIIFILKDKISYFFFILIFILYTFH